MRLASFTLNTPAATFDAGAERALRLLPGVGDVLLGGAGDTCSVVYDDTLIGTDALRAALLAAGYDCAPADAAPRHIARSASCCGSCS